MATIYNHDLKGFLDRVARFKEELIKSVSSASSELNEFDRKRIVAYLSSMDSYLDWVQAEPALDLPESSPKAYTVADAPSVIVVESEIVNDLGRLLDVCYEECLHSQSARKAAGLIAFDEARTRSLIRKCMSYIETYVSSETPLDFPESSPLAPSSGAGRTGINPS